MLAQPANPVIDLLVMFSGWTPPTQVLCESEYHRNAQAYRLTDPRDGVHSSQEQDMYLSFWRGALSIANRRIPRPAPFTILLWTKVTETAVCIFSVRFRSP